MSYRNVAAAIGVVLTACSPDFSGKLPCQDDFSCPSGFHCTAGKCVTGNGAPAVAWSAPAAGTLLAGRQTFSVLVSHPDGVSSVKLTAGTKELKTFSAPDATFGKSAPARVDFTIDTSALPDGTDELTATATSGLGASGGDAKRSFAFDNTPPTATVSVTPDPARKGAQLAIQFTASEPVTGVTATVGGASATLSANNGNDYTFSYAVTGDEPAGTAQVSVAMTDRAGNAGSATGSVTFIFAVPAAPVLSSTTPASPARSTSIAVVGTAPAQTTVALFTDSTCRSPAVATGTAAVFGSSGILVTVPDNATTTFYATATDAAGNVSPCSPTSISFTADLIAPAPPALAATVPASPGSTRTPLVTGTAEAGSTVTLFSDPGCSVASQLAAGSAAAFASPGIPITVAIDTVVNLYATATDAAGNPSGCTATSLTYATPLPVFASTSPASPGVTTSPLLVGAASPGTFVSIFGDAFCTPPALATGTAADFGSTGIAVSVPDRASRTFFVQAMDAATNTLGCATSSIGYTTAPLPTLASTSPASPEPSADPNICRDRRHRHHRQVLHRRKLLERRGRIG